MSTIVPVEKTCGNCGARLSFYQLGSTNAFGSPDLDLRPPEMQRSTMRRWLEECPKCGYVSKDISKEPPFDKNYLNSEQYINCDEIKFSSELAKTFYRKALLSLLTPNIRDAYENILHAAWCCDDGNDIETAIICRKKLDKLYDMMQDGRIIDVNSRVRHIDVLRRARMFDKSIEMCDVFSCKNELINSVVKFQKEKCIEKDVRVYTVADVLGY